jgi:proteasome lid subunit RPN8/RPN11
VIVQDAQRSYPDECCGAMFGAPGDAVEAMPLVNVTSGERRRRFLVGVDEYRTAERHADETGRPLIGFYHSHPDHPAEPSAFDLEHAWPNLSYVIVSVAAGQAGIMRSWRLRADRSRFEEETLS